MWVKTYSKVYKNVTREQIWSVWQDVNNWPQWDKELEYCKMNGEFTEGTQFILKPIDAPKVKIYISEVVKHVKFTDYCKFIGATMYDAHQLEDTPEGVRITNTISVSGILKFIWIKLVVANVVNSIPRQMDALVELAKSQ